MLGVLLSMKSGNQYSKRYLEFLCPNMRRLGEKFYKKSVQRAALNWSLFF